MSQMCIGDRVSYPIGRGYGVGTVAAIDGERVAITTVNGCRMVRRKSLLALAGNLIVVTIVADTPATNTEQP